MVSRVGFLWYVQRIVQLAEGYGLLPRASARPLLAELRRVREEVPKALPSEPESEIREAFAPIKPEDPIVAEALRGVEQLLLRF